VDDRLYKVLVYVAILMTLAWVGWSAYDSFMTPGNPGDNSYLAAEKYFEDGDYQKAFVTYQEALNEAPDHIYAKRGKARSLMQLGRLNEALQVFGDVIASVPEFAPSYANRGILYDRMGRYRKALKDYEHALQLDSELAKGPGWFTRFFRLQPEKPPTIDKRAAYLRQELAKPESGRLLRKPEMDEKQRPYKK